MSKIETIIGPQNFELVRDRVAEILADELANQFVLTSDPENNATVFLERVIPIDKTETPLINVKINRGVLEDQVAVNTHETLTIDIDIYHGAKSTDDDDGDSLSKLKMQRLMGICRAILEDPQYKTLGFEAPFIQNRHIESMEFSEGDPMDTSNKSMGRLTLSVKIPEDTALLNAIVASGFDTQIRLELTDKGYQFTSVEEPAIPPISNEWELLAAQIGRGYNLPQPTGQTTSFRTGDDADIEATIFTAAVREANSLKLQNSLASYFVLNNNNEFGNTSRFTDTVGGQDYDGTGGSLIDYVVDNYTGLGWFRLAVINMSWNDSIDGALASSAVGFTDYFVPDKHKLLSIMEALLSPFDYFPFDITETFIWSSTTRSDTTTFAMVGFLQSRILTTLKTNSSLEYILCRKHF